MRTWNYLLKKYRDCESIGFTETPTPLTKYNYAIKKSKAIKTLLARKKTITQCCECGVIKKPDGTWSEDPVEFAEDTMNISHGYCPGCFKIWRAESRAHTEAMK